MYSNKRDQHKLLLCSYKDNNSNHSPHANQSADSLSADKEKKKIRKTVMEERRKAAGSFRRNNGSEMIENFSEFIASRNLINNSSRYSRYKDNFSILKTNEQEEKKNKTNKEEVEADKIVSIVGNQAGDNNANTNKRKQRVRNLIQALLSRNSKLNKRKLLICLLRAPIVLAALFSLILVATLMIFYTMSFQYNQHHHLSLLNFQQQQHLQSSNQSANEEANGESFVLKQQQQRRRASAINEISGGGKSFVVINQNHVINSRHLDSKKVNYDATATGAGADNDININKLEQALTVQTECGSFVGQAEEGAILFKGIPYASPPVGEKRWTRPRPIWLDDDKCRPNLVAKADKFKQHCAQISPITKLYSGQEDCLYLDIYTPKLLPNSVEATKVSAKTQLTLER